MCVGMYVTLLVIQIHFQLFFIKKFQTKIVEVHMKSIGLT